MLFGHGRAYKEITLSLEIMAQSVIVTKMVDRKEGTFTSN